MSPTSKSKLRRRRGLTISTKPRRLSTPPTRGARKNSPAKRCVATPRRGVPNARTPAEKSDHHECEDAREAPGSSRMTRPPTSSPLPARAVYHECADTREVSRTVTNAQTLRPPPPACVPRRSAECPERADTRRGERPSRMRRCPRGAPAITNAQMPGHRSCCLCPRERLSRMRRHPRGARSVANAPTPDHRPRHAFRVAARSVPNARTPAEESGHHECEDAREVRRPSRMRRCPATDLVASARESGCHECADTREVLGVSRMRRHPTTAPGKQAAD